MLCTRSIDYGRFTITNYTTLEDILEGLGLDFAQKRGGGHFYRSSVLAAGGAVRVYFDGIQEDMGVCVQFSGEGARILETLPNFKGWASFMSEWIARGADFSRVDVAIDDQEGRIKFETVQKAIDNRDYSCRAQSSRLIIDRNKRGIGRTAYIGSRTSTAMLRVYDRGFKLKEPSSWLRFEWEFKDERAQAIAELIAADNWDAVAGACRAFCDFKVPGSVGQACRRKTAAWFEALISASRHVVNVAKLVLESVGRTYGWIKKQVAQSLYALTEIEGGAVDWLYDVIAEARANPSDKAKRLLNMRGVTQITGIFAN